MKLGKFDVFGARSRQLVKSVLQAYSDRSYATLLRRGDQVDEEAASQPGERRDLKYRGGGKRGGDCHPDKCSFSSTSRQLAPCWLVTTDF